MKGNIYLFLLAICIGLVDNVVINDMNKFIAAMPEEETKVIEELKGLDKNVAINYCEETVKNQKTLCTEYVVAYVTIPQYLSGNTVDAPPIMTIDDNEKEDDKSKDKSKTSEEEKEKIIEEKIKKILMKHNERLSLFKKWAKRKLDILTKKLLKKRTKK